MGSHLQHRAGPGLFLDLKAQVLLEVEVKVQNRVHVHRDPVGLPVFQRGNHPLS